MPRPIGKHLLAHRSGSAATSISRTGTRSPATCSRCLRTSSPAPGRTWPCSAGTRQIPGRPAALLLQQWIRGPGADRRGGQRRSVPKFVQDRVCRPAGPPAWAAPGGAGDEATPRCLCQARLHPCDGACAWRVWLARRTRSPAEIVCSRSQRWPRPRPYRLPEDCQAELRGGSGKLPRLGYGRGPGRPPCARSTCYTRCLSPRTQANDQYIGQVSHVGTIPSVTKRDRDSRHQAARGAATAQAR